MAIKKVVCLTKEIKYVCEISEGIYNSNIASKVYISKNDFNKQETVKPLADNEVNVEDINGDKIYILIFNNNARYKVIKPVVGQCLLANLDNSRCFSNSWETGFTDIELLIKRALKVDGTVVYQFDTQEEYLRWSLEQVTGKKFKVCDAYQGQLESSEYKLISFVNKPIEVLS